MNTYTVIERDERGYVFHHKGHVLDATYEELRKNKTLRVDLIASVYLENELLNKSINVLNNNLESRFQISPSIQVKRHPGSLYVVRCTTEDMEYIGTTVRTEDLERSEVLAILFLDLLFQDHLQLQQLLKVLAKLKEETTAAYSKG